MSNLPGLLSAVCLAVLITTADMQAGEIHDAVEAGNLGKVRMLLRADPMLMESKGKRDQTPLFAACDSGQLAVANFLIKKGANVNARDKYGFPLIRTAIKEGDECVSLVKKLLDKGADINASHPFVGAPIHTAVAANNLKVARLLVNYGADLNAPGRHGTPVQEDMIFYQNPHEETVIFLLENGAKPQEYSFGNNDLHLASIKGYANVVQTMVKHGADINAKNDYGHTPLYYAAKHGNRRAADVLIAASADKSSIVETNYGKAPQLTETLKEGQAYLWYLGGISPGTGYAVKTKNNLLIFDPSEINESQEAGLANGKLNPDELNDPNITVLLTRKEPHPHYLTVSQLAKRLISPKFIISFKPTADKENGSVLPAYRLAKANESFSVGGMQIRTIKTSPSSLGSTGNLGYLVQADGVKIFHAGLHCSNWAVQKEKYRKDINFLKPFGPIDIAILPISGRHLGDVDYKQYLYLIDQLSPKAIYLIGNDMVYEEHRKCLDVLKERNVPVFYPDGGVALGQRFHYPPQESKKNTNLSGDYLGQTPAGETPVVFAQGIVSTQKNKETIQRRRNKF